MGPAQRRRSLPFRLKRGWTGSKRSDVDEGTAKPRDNLEDSQDNNNNVERQGRSLSSLPFEIQSLILLYLPLPSILSLRLTSRPLSSLVTSNANTVAIKVPFTCPHSLPSYDPFDDEQESRFYTSRLRLLYPTPPSTTSIDPTETLHYILGVFHRQSVIENTLDSFITYLARHMGYILLPRVSERPRYPPPELPPDYHGLLMTFLRGPLTILYHYLETFPDIVSRQPPNSPDQTLRDLQNLISSYPISWLVYAPDLLVTLIHVLTKLLFPTINGLPPELPFEALVGTLFKRRRSSSSHHHHHDTATSPATTTTQDNPATTTIPELLVFGDLEQVQTVLKASASTAPKQRLAHVHQFLALRCGAPATISPTSPLPPPPPHQHDTPLTPNIYDIQPLNPAIVDAVRSALPMAETVFRETAQTILRSTGMRPSRLRVPSESWAFIRQIANGEVEELVFGEEDDYQEEEI